MGSTRSRKLASVCACMISACAVIGQEGERYAPPFRLHDVFVELRIDECVVPTTNAEAFWKPGDVARLYFGEQDFLVVRQSADLVEGAHGDSVTTSKSTGAILFSSDAPAKRLMRLATNDGGTLGELSFGNPFWYLQKGTDTPFHNQDGTLFSVEPIRDGNSMIVGYLLTSKTLLHSAALVTSETHIDLSRFESSDEVVAERSTIFSKSPVPYLNYRYTYSGRFAGAGAVGRFPEKVLVDVMDETGKGDVVGRILYTVTAVSELTEPVTATLKKLEKELVVLRPGERYDFSAKKVVQIPGFVHSRSTGGSGGGLLSMQGIMILMGCLGLGAAFVMARAKRPRV